MTPRADPTARGSSGTVGADRVAERDFAERSVIGWHLLFAAMGATTIVAMATEGQLVIASLGIGAMVIAYVVVAVPAAYCGDGRRALGYVVFACTVLLVLEWQSPTALILLFALYPQIFMLLPRRSAIIAVVVLSLAFSLVLVALDGWTATAWAWHGLAAAGNIVFALIIGLFIDGLVRESRSRRELVDELRATRDELAAAERAAGAVAERERLARDIHDTLAQGFTSIVMLSQAGEAAAAKGAHADAVRRFTEIQATARDNLAEARALVSAMSPPALEQGGLVAAIGRLAAKHEAETGTAVRFSVHGEARALASSSEVAALRATQELLSNARKHSGASGIDVVLAFDDDGATVTVADDGDGFDATAPRSGYGLNGLATRIEAVGGLTSVSSEPGFGTQVKVRVP